MLLVFVCGQLSCSPGVQDAGHSDEQLSVVQAHGGAAPEQASPDGDGIGAREADTAIAETKAWTERAREIPPEMDGWRTEKFSSQATGQLKRLGKLLNEPDADDFESLLTDGFRCDALRPSGLAEIYHEGVLRVLRPEAGAHGDSPSLVGEAGLRKSLAALRAVFAGNGEFRTAFKVFRVEADADRLRTKAYFQASGTGRDVARVQAGGTLVCDWTLPDGGRAPRLERMRVEGYEEVLVGGDDAGRLREVTQSVLGEVRSYRDQLAYGIDHWRGRLQNTLGLPLDGFHGLAVGDANGDGTEDVYVCQPGGLPNRLLLHEADGTVRDASAEAGVDWLEQTASALLVDLDNDGDQDLVVALSSGVIVQENDGNGRFRIAFGQTIPGGMMGLAAADYDSDGDLDVYAYAYSGSGLRPEHVGEPGPFPFHNANNGAPNMLLENDGRLRFRDVTADVGLDENNRRFTNAAAWEDYDNDGDLDLYVANDFGQNNLYRNDGGGRFKDIAESSGVVDSGPGMSVAWGDYDNDGRPDLYISNMFSSAGGRVAWQERFQEEANETTRAVLRRFARGNSLFRGGPDGEFADVSLEAGVTMGRWAWASQFADLNNDGREDLLVANGMITQADPGDL